MDSLERLNMALSYIEDHLASEFDFRQVEKLALCSEYHFRRLFSFLAGVSLSEYIRRRRLTLAAFDLIRGNERVIDIAIKYGYASPDAFARAFSAMHGITPTEAKTNGQSLKAYPRMSFRLTVKGENEMKYRIEEKGAFHIVGIMKRVPLIYEGVNPEITLMWQSLNEDMITTLKSLSNVFPPPGLITASTNFSAGPTEGGQLDQYIGVATYKSAPDNFAQLEVPPLTWAVFEVVGPFPQTLQDTWASIFSEWLPSSNYELVKGPEILWNENKDVASPIFHSEIWIPVNKRL